MKKTEEYENEERRGGGEIEKWRGEEERLMEGKKKMKNGEEKMGKREDMKEEAVFFL